MKCFRSKNYNYNFDYTTGYFERLGETKGNNPQYSPYGPEILDIELSTACNNNCRFCYKDNTSKGKNMSLDTIKIILNKLPKFKNQYNKGVHFCYSIAYGIGTISECPQLFDILQYTRDQGIIPNITINEQIDSFTAKRLTSLCGGVAVSHTNNDVCFNTVKELIDANIQQVTIHQVLSMDTYEQCLNLIDDCKNDNRLKKLSALVFLMLKPRGRGKNQYPVRSKVMFKYLIDYAIKNKVNIGFDSCSIWSFLESVDDSKKYEIMCDPCESNRFSGYVNVNGRYFHCSFCENEDGWKGIDLLKVTNFKKEVWYNPEVIRFRNQSIENEKNKKACQLFDLDLIEI